jgi:DinB family protein
VPVEEDRATLIDRFAAGADAVRAAAARLQPAQYDRAPVGEWTPRQILMHLADSELVGSVRLRLLLAEDDPTFPIYAQERWATGLRYADADDGEVARAVDLFAQQRDANARLVRQAPASDWSRAGRHPQRGRMTLYDVVRLYADHVDGHLEQIERDMG